MFFWCLLMPLSLWGEETGPVQFTEAERLWLKKNAANLTAAHITHYDIAGFEEDDSYCEIAKEYLKEVENKTGIRFKIQTFNNWQEAIRAARQGSIDLIPLIEMDSKTTGFLDFSSPYLETPTALVTRKNIPPEN